MAQSYAHRAREGLNTYGDTHVAPNAHLHQGNVYVSNADISDDVGNDKDKAKAGECDWSPLSLALTRLKLSCDHFHSQEWIIDITA